MADTPSGPGGERRAGAVLAGLRTGGRLAALVVIMVVWFATACQFVTVMAGRLHHVGTAAPFSADPPCAAPQCDFSAFWPAGLLARQGSFRALYQPPSFLAWRQHVLGPAASALDWYYPPPVLLPAAAISTLPFELGFFVWVATLTGLAVIVLRSAALPWPVIGLGLLSPAALWNGELGQLGAITGSLLVAGLLALPAAPTRAGVWLGCLLFKPQAAILAPLALLAASRRALLAGTATAGAWLLVTTLLLGTAAWAGFFAYGQSSARAVLQLPFPAGTTDFFGVSVFWMVRSFGAGLRLAYTAQATAALLAAALAWRLWHRRSDADATSRMALTVFLSLLATPYGYTDDMVAYSIALAALARRRGWQTGLADALFWLWPGLCPIVTHRTGILVTPLVVALAVWRTWHRAGLGVPLLPRPPAVLTGAG